MLIPTWERWSGTRLSTPPKSRSNLRVGIPRVLNIWSTHQFWLGFLVALGCDPRRIVFSEATSDEQGREYGRGRGTVDCCYPVKCMSGHYGELVFGQKHGIDILLSPMIRSLPSFLNGHVVDSLACPRVMAAPENIKAGFLKERDVFAERGIKYISPFVSLAEPLIVPRQLHRALEDALPGLTLAEVHSAVAAGYKALAAFNRQMQDKGREILRWCAENDRPCIMVLARPYHMDPGIGHEIEADLQAYGYPILWAQYLPVDADLMQWLFGGDIENGTISSPFDVRDVWPSSYSGNTNEILWGAKVAARLPWVTCVIRLASYECGMDQPTYTPVQKIVEGRERCSFRFRTSTPPSRRDRSRSGSRLSPTTWSVRRRMSSQPRSYGPNDRVRCWARPYDNQVRSQRTDAPGGNHEAHTLSGRGRICRRVCGNFARPGR